MKRWKAWIAGALALAGLAGLPSAGEARTMAAPELIPLQASTPATGTATPGVAPTCQYGYGYGYGHRGWRGRHGYGRGYGFRRHGWRGGYGYRRPYGWRRPYGFRHRFYRPIGFYGRPYGYGYRRHYGW